jgi:hypothetical protein
MHDGILSAPRLPQQLEGRKGEDDIAQQLLERDPRTDAEKTRWRRNTNDAYAWNIYLLSLSIGEEIYYRLVSRFEVKFARESLESKAHRDRSAAFLIERLRC